MRLIIFFSSLVFIQFLSAFQFMANAQHYDLIVKKNSDSIACSIDSISAGAIYFSMRSRSSLVHTSLTLSEIADYSQNSINSHDYWFKRGTTYIERKKAVKYPYVNRNLIYGNATYLLYSYSITLNYERLLSINRDLRGAWGLRLGFGIINTSGKMAMATLTNLRGKGKNKFEMSFGGVFINEEHSFSKHFVSVCLTAGYRYQNPESQFMFRTGIGTPEGIYAGIGYQF